MSMVDDENLFGAALRDALPDRLSRQLLLAIMIDVPPTESNRVSVDPSYTDALGNMRPVISYTVPEYTMRGVAYARQFARQIFQRLGAADYTRYDPTDPPTSPTRARATSSAGGNHLAGTPHHGHRPDRLVVDVDQRSWDHRTRTWSAAAACRDRHVQRHLTLAALCYRSATKILNQLRADTSAA
jgi:hypothetical protein